MKIRTLFFGISKDIASESSSVLELNENATIHHLTRALMDKYPGFSSINEFSIALNEEYVENDALLKENDVVAIIPPVSGG